MWSKFIAWLSSFFATKPSEFLWMARARSKIGEKEISGGKNNQFIVDCFDWTTYDADDDETAWCAAFVAWAVQQRSASAAAKWWATYGTACALIPGAIVVVRHLTGKLKGRYHVTFCESVISETSFNGLGGNQQNKVGINHYGKPDYEIVACRWPVKK